MPSAIAFAWEHNAAGRADGVIPPIDREHRGAGGHGAGRSYRSVVWDVIRRITSETADALESIASARSGGDEVKHAAGVAAVRLHRGSEASAAFRTYTLDRRNFVSALSGYQSSTREAEALVLGRLGTLRTALRADPPRPVTFAVFVERSAERAT